VTVRDGGPHRTVGRLIGRITVMLASLAFALIGFVQVAQAHAMLESSAPAAGAVTAHGPATVSLHFGESVQLPQGALRVLDGSGRVVQTGSAFHPGGDGSGVAVALKPGIADGSYLVLWRVVSADSHPVDGTFTFSVGHPGEVSTEAATGSDPFVGGLLATSRFLGFLGIAVSLGGMAFVIFLWPEGASSRRSRSVVAGGWAIAVAATVAALVLEGPYGAGSGVLQTFDPHLLWAVVGTRYGVALVARICLLVGVAVVARSILRRQTRSRTGPGAFAVLSLATFGSYAVTGHSSVGSLVPLAMASDIAHLTSMSVWIGGLVQLAGAVLPDAPDEVARRVSARFSTVALTAVTTLIVSGTYLAWRQAGIFDDLTTTRYGGLLLVKVGLVATVLVVAYFSRRLVNRSSGSAAGSVAAIRGLRRPVVLEAGLTIVVLGVTSLLVSAPPARGDYRPSSSARMTAGPAVVTLSVVPLGTRDLDIQLDTSTAAGRGLKVPELDAQVAMASRDIDPISLVLTNVGGTKFVAKGVQLPYTGTWTVTVQARTDDIDEYSATTDVVVR
jgi:copper transport protein